MSSYRSKRRRIIKDVQSTINSLSKISPEVLVTPLRSVPSYKYDFSLGNSNIHSLENVVSPSIELTPSSASSQVSLKHALSHWAISFNISHNALDSLLPVLNNHLPDNEILPVCAKTLLHTPRKITVTSIKGGKFSYFGIKDQILRVSCSSFRNECKYPILKTFVNLNDSNDLLSITVSTDGFPVCKSSNTQMWPILFTIDQVKNMSPVLAGLFCGESKPCCVKEFLKPFIEEVRDLELNGLTVDSVKYRFRISAIIADAPARSFIKGCKGHNGYHSCERCIDEGEYNGRIIYSVKSSTLRSDESFRAKLDIDHHVYDSPLAILNVGLVSQVVIDSMHCFYLGIMRKLLNIWISGPIKNRMQSKKVFEISDYLCRISKHVPYEFNRKPRSLKDINRFKATEFRQLLLYTAPMAFRGILSDEAYIHFLKLHSAVYILLSNNAHVDEWNNLAKSLLEKFVSDMKNIYGATQIVYNVHSLLHISDDAKLFGSLDNVSAFPFENHLQFLKKQVRGKKLQLEQIVKRVEEARNSDYLQSKSARCKNYVQGKNKVIRRYFLEKFSIGTKFGDNCFLDGEMNIVLVKSITIDDIGKPNFICQKILTRNTVGMYPIKSSKLCMYKLSLNLSNDFVLNSNLLFMKCVLLPYRLDSSCYYCIPMLNNYINPSRNGVLLT